MKTLRITPLLLALATATTIGAPRMFAGSNHPGTVVEVTADASSEVDADDEADDKKEREQEAAEAARDRAEEKRDRAEEARDREEKFYDEGTEALDEHNWRTAAHAFKRASEMKLGHADAALYWLAYAENKMGKRSEALGTLVTLQQSYPKSRWNGDGRALDAEIRQSAGQQIEPEHVSDEDVKLMALNGLMNSDPSRAIPLLDNIVRSGAYTEKVKERALFVLSQSKTPPALEVLGRLAKDSSHPQLQARALNYLGIAGGDESLKVLTDVYAATADLNVKLSTLKSLMIAGDRARILEIAKKEKDAQLRSDAVRQLGILGAKGELAELYGSENDLDTRKSIIQAMFIGGNADKLVDIARSEKVPELRVTAIKNLGLLSGGKSGPALTAIYESDTNPEVRRAVIEAFFIQGNSKALVGLARKEKNPELKRDLVSKLSIIGSDDAKDYLLEYLKE